MNKTIEMIKDLYIDFTLFNIEDNLPPPDIDIIIERYEDMTGEIVNHETIKNELTEVLKYEQIRI